MLPYDPWPGKRASHATSHGSLLLTGKLHFPQSIKVALTQIGGLEEPVPNGCVCVWEGVVLGASRGPLGACQASCGGWGLGFQMCTVTWLALPTREHLASAPRRAFAEMLASHAEVLPAAPEPPHPFQCSPLAAGERSRGLRWEIFPSDLLPGSGGGQPCLHVGRHGGGAGGSSP